MSKETLSFPESHRPFLDPYLPPTSRDNDYDNDNGSGSGSGKDGIFVTLTFATSLDSSLSIAPGTRTVLSGPQSKAMTHYLRSKHDAILIGVGTAVADNPGLNCRLHGVRGYLGHDLGHGQGRGHSGTAQGHSGEGKAQGEGEGEGDGQPRPVVIDPSGRWDITQDAQILRLVREGCGLAPFILTMKEVDDRRREVLEAHGGKYIILPSATVTATGPGTGPVTGSEAESEAGTGTSAGTSTGAGTDARTEAKAENATGRLEWPTIFKTLKSHGLNSVMVEGGSGVINTLLEPDSQTLVDSVIVTIAPTWLGQGGVVVSPKRRFDASGAAIPASRLKDVKWHPFGEDVVLCGRL